MSLTLMEFLASFGRWQKELLHGLSRKNADEKISRRNFDIIRGIYEFISCYVN